MRDVQSARLALKSERSYKDCCWYTDGIFPFIKGREGGQCGLGRASAFAERCRDSSSRWDETPRAV